MPLKYVSTLPLFTLVIVACQQTDKSADISMATSKAIEADSTAIRQILQQFQQCL